MADMEVGTEEETSLPEGELNTAALLQETAYEILQDPNNYSVLIDNSGFNGIPGPRVLLRWSNTRGASWQGSLSQSLGSAGQYNTQPAWQRLGMARDRIWELSWVTRGKTALNGAWVNFTHMKS